MSNIDFTLVQTIPTDLEVERRNMRAFRRAMNVALGQRPATDSPLSVQFPDAVSLLDAVARLEEFLGPEHDLTRARRDIFEYIRQHPDVAAFQGALGVSDEYIDQLFRDAIALEGQQLIA